jgi:thioredoxin 1
MLQITDDMGAIMSAKESVVAFTAEWCGPCKQLKPQFAKASVLDSNKDYFIVDIDKIDKKYLDEYNIKSVPSVFVMSEGNAVKKVDARTAPEIVKEAV